MRPSDRLPGSFPGPAQWARIRITRKQASKAKWELCAKLMPEPKCRVGTFGPFCVQSRVRLVQVARCQDVLPVFLELCG